MMTTAPTTTSSVMSAAYRRGCGNQVFNSGIVVIRLQGITGDDRRVGTRFGVNRQGLSADQWIDQFHAWMGSEGFVG